MEPAQVSKHVDRGIDLEQQREHGDAVGHHGERRPRVGDDHLDAGVFRDRAVEHQVDDRPRGVEEELEHRPGTSERGVLPARRRRRVDEEASLAAVELTEHRRERGISEVGAADVREDSEPRDAELVAAVRDLGDRGVDIGKRE